MCVYSFTALAGIKSFKYDHEHNLSPQFLSCGTVYCAVQGGFNFGVCK